MKKVLTLFSIEMKLSLRGMDMLIFAIFMPITIMAVLGVIYGNTPAYEGADYTFVEQSFGAVSTISIAAGGVMGLPLVISDYRNKKVLKRLKVTPTSPALLLAVQFLIYMVYAIVSLVLVYLTGAIFFNLSILGSWSAFLAAFLLVLVSLFSIGILVGGVASNIKTADVIASVLYFPMLLFSGATLPYEVMSTSMQRIADFMPLTQGIKLIKAAVLGQSVEHIIVSLTSLILLTVICTSLCLRYFKWE